MKTSAAIFLKNNKWLILFLVLFLPFQISAQEKVKTEDLFKMSLEELMNMEVSMGNLVGMSLSKNPAAITIITREDIEKTPARNILELIEIYVPGSMMLNNISGPLALKLRGLGIRNYKTILLVNGRPVNQKAYFGSAVEITNWDLNDIERIEVVRGPGSVTYGPGAIAGVINIITKHSGSLNGFKAGAEYNPTYNSKGIFLQYGLDGEKFKLFTNFSIRDTNGNENTKYFQSKNNGEIGYTGTEAHSSSDGFPNQDFYQDYFDKPQIKAHLDLSYLYDWRFWMRYTISGQAFQNNTKRLSCIG